MGRSSTIVEYDTRSAMKATWREDAELSTQPSTIHQEGTLERISAPPPPMFSSALQKNSIPSGGHLIASGFGYVPATPSRTLKEALPAGLVGKSKQAEPVARTEPYLAELEAKAIADRILEVRSEAYVRRWCDRPDVDDVDRDIVNLNLIRPPSRNGSQPPFHSLAEIAARHGISRQAVAKRRDRIVDDLIGATNKR